jgi:uncharacterized membrane protein
MIFTTWLLAIAAILLAVNARSAARRANTRLERLFDTVQLLDRRLVQLGGGTGEAEQTPRPQPSAIVEAAAAAGPPTEPARDFAPTTRPHPVSGLLPVTRPNWAQFERNLVENWLVWLGGVALALGGAFLVKLSIDYGLIMPSVRVVLGVLFGLSLAGCAEWVRRRELGEDGAADPPSYVPPALAAAGAASVFASFYAAYALYGLLPAGLAFVLLAVTAGATVGASLRHGPYVAAIGLAGAYAVPLLVASDSPHALPLFGYLAIVTAGALALLRHRGWWWLAWLSLAGAMLWVPLWLAEAGDPEAPVVAGYLLVQLGLFFGFRRGVPRIGFLAGIADTPMVRVVTRSAFWAIAAALVLAANADRFGTASVGAAFVTVITLLALAYRDSAIDDVIAAAGALALALLASWHLPLPLPELNFLAFRVGPDQIVRFTATAVALALLLGAGGFLALPGAARPGRWAALSAAAPLAILVIAYWRLQKFELDVAWTLTALALAGLELAAAAVVAKRRDGRIEIEIALAAYAVGILAGTIVAAAFGLGEAWLTVALALHLPALGWIDGKIRIPAMRWVALGVAGIVLVRLVLNPYVLQYPLGPTPIVNWLLYGYGVPALAFIVATRQFGSRADDWLVWMLEAGSIAFAFLLLTLELDHALYGYLTFAPLTDFANGAAMVALWLGFAAVVFLLGDRRQRPVLLWSGRLLLGGATAAAVPWQFFNLAFGAPVGNMLIFDALLLADAAPALIYAAIAWLVPGRPILRAMGRVLATAFAFVWVTLEIRHAFQGEVSLFAGSGEAEWYTYSAAWLAFAGAALGFGLVRRNEWLRRVGLIGIGLVIGKVFLSDMAELTGVLRALSFIGLGGALVGIGYAYRRLQPMPPQPLQREPAAPTP